MPTTTLVCSLTPVEERLQQAIAQLRCDEAMVAELRADKTAAMCRLSAVQKNLFAAEAKKAQSEALRKQCAEAAEAENDTAMLEVLIRQQARLKALGVPSA